MRALIRVRRHIFGGHVGESLIRMSCIFHFDVGFDAAGAVARA